MTSLRTIVSALLALLLSGAPPAHAEAPSDCSDAGLVTGEWRIAEGEGGFTGNLDAGDLFGGAVAVIGDVDGDGVDDVAVGSGRDDDTGTDAGAVFILFMQADHTVRSHQKISGSSGGFVPPTGWSTWQLFGHAVARLGDLNGDGTPDIAVGAPYGGLPSVYTLFLNPDGTVKAQARVPGPAGFFGSDIAPLGDLDGDGVVDIVVGGNGQAAAHAFWVVFLQADGTARAVQEVSAGAGGMQGLAASNGGFGGYLTTLGDRDGDGRRELVTAERPGDPPRFPLLWILSLQTDGTVKDHWSIASDDPAIGVTDSESGFGHGLEPCDLNGDGNEDLLVGAKFDGDGGEARGAIWAVFLDSECAPLGSRKISQLAGGFSGSLLDGDWFGTGLAVLDVDATTERVSVLASAPRAQTWAYPPNEPGVVWGLEMTICRGCRGDVDRDTDTDVFDFGVLATYFGQTVAPFENGDLDGDGVVTVFDFAELASDFGCLR